MIVVGFRLIDSFTHRVSALRGRLQGFSRRMAALQLVGIGELFASACKLKLASVQAGARHAAQAAGFQSGLQASGLQAFKPARGMPRKLPAFTLIAACPAPP